jgi:hypothetical protein
MICTTVFFFSCLWLRRLRLGRLFVICYVLQNFSSDSRVRIQDDQGGDDSRLTLTGILRLWEEGGREGYQRGDARADGQCRVGG